jgi:hypothetical protein
LSQIEGDPGLLPFTLHEDANMTSHFCALRNALVTFFLNRYITIEVVNGGGFFGNIVSL